MLKDAAKEHGQFSLAKNKTATSCEVAAVDLMPGGEHLDPAVESRSRRGWETTWA